jgi:hypothetical protein
MLLGAIVSLFVDEDLRKDRFEQPLLNDYTPNSENEH